ncbi:type VI secretion system tube protein Hcp [Shewanella sp. Isolate11]|nr:type VI secretion system tube protein Hcp [Shewanella sp. Isolate11]
MNKLILSIALSICTFTTYAAVDMFLKIGDIEGESQDIDHKNEIDVLAWSWGTSADSRRICIQDLSVTKWADKSSPALLMNQITHVSYPKATLTVRKAGANPLEYIIIEMTDVYVSSLSNGGSGGEDRLTENISLNFDQLKYTYFPQSIDGSPAEKVEATISSEKCN